MALSDMFWPLNGATATPRRASSRHSPVITVDLPASDVVPHTMSAPCIGACSTPPRRRPRLREVPLDHGARRHPCVGRHTFGRSPGTRTEPDRVECVDARPRAAAGGQPGHEPGPRSPSGGVRARSAEATTREVAAVAIAEDLAVIHEPGVEDPFNVEQHGIDYIPDQRALGHAQGHLRHVGRRQRPGRVLHLRRHPDDVRLHLRPGALHHRPRQPVLLAARAVLACRDPTPARRSSPSTGRPSGPTARGRSRSSTGSPRSASRSRA